MDPTDPTAGGAATTTRIPPQTARRSRPRSAGVVTPHGQPGVYIYPFWQRSEFWALLITAIGVGIGALADDTFGARSAWLYITILSAAYILSRGFAKREPRDDSYDDTWTPGDDDGSTGGGRFGRG